MKRIKKLRVFYLIVTSIVFFTFFLNFSGKKAPNIPQKIDIAADIEYKGKRLIKENSKDIDDGENYQTNQSYIINIGSARINKLLKLLRRKEKPYESIIKDLKLISFEELVKNKNNHEYNKLKVNNGEVEVTEEFVNELRAQADVNSFGSHTSRKKFVKEKIIQVSIL